MKYAIEMTVKFEADSDRAAKEMTKVVIDALGTVLDATHSVTRVQADIDEIRLIDDGFGTTYGENRIIGLSDLFAESEEELKGNDSSASQEEDIG